MSKRIKWSDTLPETEGTVFVAYSPGAPFAVLGRRWHGGLYPGTLLSQKVGGSPDRDFLKETPGAEFVEGPEADQLITALDAEEKAKRPLFVFIRNHEVEAEVGIELAGTLYLDVPRKKIGKRATQKLVQDLLRIIKDRDLAPNEGMYGWPDKRGAFYSDAITDNDELMAEWSRHCTIIKVRLMTSDGEPPRPDSELLRCAGFAKTGSRLQ